MKIPANSALVGYTAAAGGRHCLRAADSNPKTGSNVFSSPHQQQFVLLFLSNLRRHRYFFFPFFPSPFFFFALAASRAAFFASAYFRYAR